MACIWGVNFAVIKGALQELDPLVFNALRFPLAAAFLYVILRSRGRIPLPERRDVPLVLALGLAANLVYQLLFIYGLDATLAGNASLILATTPVWTTVLSRIAGHDRVDWHVWVGITGTLAGIVLVVVGGSAALGAARSTLPGDLLTLAASLVWSGYTVRARSLIHRYGPLAITAWTLWIGTAGLVLMGIPGALRTDFAAVSAAAWAGVAYAGLLAIGVAYILWNWGVRRLGNPRTAVYGNLVPIVALSAAWILLGERPTTVQLVGAAVVIGSVLLARSRTGAVGPDGEGYPVGHGAGGRTWEADPARSPVPPT